MAANDEVRLTLESLARDRGEVGLQVAAYLKGELVVDTWAGLADADEGRAVDGETLFTAFSASKGIVATCIHVLRDRGLLEYDAPIARYWPEFGQRDKAKATVGDALAHRVGVPQDPPGLDLSQAADWDSICRSIAALEPLWEPGSRTGYHALTYGWILGEVVRRVDGRPIARFLEEEVCDPLGSNAMYFGVPADKEELVAKLTVAPGLEDLVIPLNPSLCRPAETFNRSVVRRASIPGAGAILNARSLARHYAALANDGELGGVRILSRETIRRATALQADTPAAGYSRWWHAHGLGYTLGGGPGPMAGHPSAFGYEGLGTIGFADPAQRFAFAFLKNQLDWSDAEMETATLVERAVERVLELGG